MRRLLFAANWKMHVSPAEAREYLGIFLQRYAGLPDRVVWFFPPAVSLEAAAQAAAPRHDLLIGAQDIHWEPKGAFTGAVSAPLVKAAGARAVLVGHSERRHVFGETDADTGRKVRAALDAVLHPVLCVGERLEEREGGGAFGVVTRQLEAALEGLEAAALDRITVAYEPVWAIGTGRTATPAQAREVHGALRRLLTERGGGPATRILYGGSVKAENAAALLREPEIDGALVGGASLVAEQFARIVEAARPA